MLETLTQKLCPLLSLALFAIGCGKAIEDSDLLSARSRDSQEIPSSYLLQLNGPESYLRTYIMPESARFMIPDRLRVLAGNPAGQTVEIALEVNEFNRNESEYKCTYKPNQLQDEMILEKCVDYLNRFLGNVSFEIGLRRDHIIEIRFAGVPSSELIVETRIQMDWIIPQI